MAYQFNCQLFFFFFLGGDDSGVSWYITGTKMMYLGILVGNDVS